MNDLKNAKIIFEAVQDKNINLDVRCINTLLSIYKDAMVFPSLEKVFQFFERARVRPDAFTFSLLFICCHRTSQAVKVIDQILEAVSSW